MYVDAHGAYPRSQSIFYHVTGKPGVFTYNDVVTLGLGLDDKGDSPADLHGYFRGHGVAVCNPAYAVCSKELSHCFFLMVFVILQALSFR